MEPPTGSLEPQYTYLRSLHSDSRTAPNAPWQLPCTVRQVQPNGQSLLRYPGSSEDYLPLDIYLNHFVSYAPTDSNSFVWYPDAHHRDFPETQVVRFVDISL